MLPLSSDPITKATRKRRLVFAEWYLRRRYRGLFVSLMLGLVLGPVIQEYQLRSWPLELLYLINLVAAALGVDSPKRRKWILATITIAVVLAFFGRRLHFIWVSEFAATTFVGLATLAISSTLQFALKGRRVDSERLAAALSTYLLAGHMFALCYWQLEQWRAGSFAAGGIPFTAGALDLPTCVYFSFVTLATLGYGDIVPLAPTARGLAVTEAIVGQLYLAVLIARLVGGGSTKVTHHAADEAEPTTENSKISDCGTYAAHI